MNHGHKVVEKPWGQEVWICLNDDYCFKKITVNGGHKTSLQYHNTKRETIYIVCGSATFTKEAKTFFVCPGDIINLEPGVVHRVEAGTNGVVFFEVSTPQVDDVVRVQDDYGRNEI